MKTLLAATDFSETSMNAINYAAQIAKRNDSKLILFHVFHFPVIVSDVTVILPSPKEMENESMKYLLKIKTLLETKHTSLIIECVCKNGLAVDEIIEYVHQNKIDFVVMGMQGAGFLEEKIAGSVTTSLIQKADFPVLTINKGVKFKLLKKITLATDYAEIKNENVLKPLKYFAGMNKSHIYILNVLTKRDIRPTIEEAVAGVKLEHSMEEFDHSFHYIKNDNLMEGINDFTSTYKIDLLVMVPRKHTSFKNMFIEPATKRVAFHCRIPLLTLHE